MNKKWIAAFFAIVVIGTWGLVFATLINRAPGDTPQPLPTVAVLPTQIRAVDTNTVADSDRVIPAAGLLRPTSTIPVATIDTPAESTPEAQASDQVVIHFAAETSESARSEYLTQNNAQIIQTIPRLNAVVVSVTEDTPLPESPVIESTEPDYYAHALVDVPTSDTHYAQQWGLEVIGAPQVWPTLPDDMDTITIAVVDSGICAGHPDLSGRIIAGYDYVDDDSSPQDAAGHGCAVAGVIAANIDNGMGIAGVAPNTQIMPVRVLDANGIGTYSDVAAGIVYAVDHGAQIINLSLGGPQSSSILANAISYAASHDVLVIAAAGNTGTTDVYFPAAYDSVVAVGSVDSTLQRSSFSTYGPEIDLLAPGRDILSTHLSGDYSLSSGTSLAAPHVTGVAALEMARGNSLTLDGGIVSLGDIEVVQPPTPDPGSIPPQYADLYAKAVDQGMVRVIVGLNAPFQPPANLSSAQAQQQQITIAQVQQQVISGLSAYNARVVSQSDTWPIPALALEVNADGLEYLISTPTVTDIDEDVPVPLLLNTSVPIINGNDAHGSGYTGQGQTIVILDSGVDATHPTFGGRVVEEVCSSTTFAPDGSLTLCPNNDGFMFGNGAASPILCSDLPLQAACWHGTHVAGIAAGEGGGGASPGVAPDATIIAMQVFSRFQNFTLCGQTAPCLLSYPSDQLYAMFFTLDFKEAYNIASINMSLGGGAYPSACDNNGAVLSGFRDAVALLRSEGIATIAAAGNLGTTSGIAAPACLSTVVSVGATNAVDSVLSFSQSAANLDLLAPGYFISSANIGGGTLLSQGTSMATPHVAGAWAVLKQAAPDSTVDQILNAFKSTGPQITDSRNGVTRRRIDVQAALQMLLTPDLIVNTTTDDIIGVCDATHCSLREAIIDSNASTGIRKTVRFNIPPESAPFIIAPNTALPTITNRVIIDGTTQDGYTGTPIIELDGSNLAATENGLNITGGNSIIRGLTINNFPEAGINLNSGGNNIIVGNYLGIEPDGTAQAPNKYGIRLCASSNNQIGGANLADRNVISGNEDVGIQLTCAGGSSNNFVRNNFIGVDATGTTALGNGIDGIRLHVGTHNTIGGANTSVRNIISGNVRHGIHIDASNNLVQGNYIGVDVNGAALGNGANGVAIEGGSSGNTIGTGLIAASIRSLDYAFGNRIAHNAGDGINLTSNSNKNAIFFNEIFDNGGLGIDLNDNDSVNENDANDVDNGANDLINFPNITSATGSSNSLNITWTYHGTPNASIGLDFYISTACDDSGNGEGQTYIGTDFLITDGSGNANGSVLLSTSVLVGSEVVTATATNENTGSTSEFSNCQVVTADPNQLVVNTHDDLDDGICDFHCSLREAIIIANNMPGQQTIAFAMPEIADGVILAIQPFSPLPVVEDSGGAATIMDGTTQPGYTGTPLVELSGSRMPVSGDGLTLGSNTTVRGLAIHSFIEYGIDVQGNFNTVEGNYLGLNSSGQARPNLRSGILVAGNNNLIGGTSPAARNIISGNIHNGVYLRGNATNSHTNTVQGNYIGTNPAGTSALPNGLDGIRIRSSDNIIGGTVGITPGGPCTGACNLISGNGDNGISITDDTTNSDIEADNNNIQGNFIGTNLPGTAPIANGESGIHLQVDTKSNIIGGSDPAEANLISGNAQYGVEISGDSETSNNNIVGNTIGTNITGTAALGNGLGGILLSAQANQNVIAENIIAGNISSGVRIDGSGTSNNTLTGNYIGTNAAGTAALANTSHGIYVFGGASDNLIGTTAENTGNLISGNGGSGVYIQGITSTGNQLKRNYIGTDTAGTVAIPNNGHGVFLDQAQNNRIGQDTSTSITTGIPLNDGNLISGNSANGIFISGSNANSNEIIGNYIGTTLDGLSALGNGGSGIDINNGDSNHLLMNIISGNSASGIFIHNFGLGTLIQLNFVGGSNDVYNIPIPNNQHGIHLLEGNSTQIGATDVPGFNVIAYNTGDGIRVESGNNNAFYTNAILENGGLGINLGADGITANDTGDADNGPNARQNFPIITEVRSTITGIDVDGTLNSSPNATFRIEVFRGATCDPSGHGEGASYLGAIDVVTDGSGDGDFAFTSPVVVESGWFITTTATNPDNSTSEFSACVEAILYVATPEDFTATVNSEIDIELTWTDVSPDETHWVIERSVTGEGDWQQIASIETSDMAGTGGGESYHDNDFLCSVSYDYRLRAYNEPGDYYSLYTAVENATPVCPPLLPPADFVAAPISRSQIDLTWTDTNTTETNYVIEHSANGGLSWTTLTVLPPDSTSYEHVGLTCVSTHDYRMRTVRNHAGPYSDYTEIQSTTTLPCPAPVAPANPAAVALSRNQIEFSWAVGDPGETTTFHIERSGDGVNFAQVMVVPAQITSIVDGGLSCGQTYHYRVRSYRAEDNSYSGYSASASDTTDACAAPVEHTVGLYREGLWQFWNTNEAAAPAITFHFGPRQSGWMPVVGDWDGDGTDGIGLYKDGLWVLRNASNGGPVDLSISFGPREGGWLPIAGDWDGDGTDGIGLYRNGMFILRQTATSGPPEITFNFGPTSAGYLPIAGDWNHSGSDSIGLFKDGLWLLSNSLPARSDVPPFYFGQTQPGWSPLAGDWDGDGTTSIGVYKDRLWHLRNSNNTGTPDIGYSFPSGSQNWKPLASYRGGMGGLSILAMETAPEPPVLPTSTPTPEDAPQPTDEPTAESTPEVTEEIAPEITEEAAPTDEPTPEPTAEPTATPVPSTPEPPTATSVPPTATPQPTEQEPPAEVTEEST